MPLHRRQFLFEAEVTGSLEHPGVVPVHGLGEYPDKRPFYAMRFIRGVSLKDAIQHYLRKFGGSPEKRATISNDPTSEAPDRKQASADQAASAWLDVILPPDENLAFRELLMRFCEVCNTLEYAHSRGVLHRDLKPDNIMLGRYGETFVVDWGLAQYVDRPSEETLVEGSLRARLGSTESNNPPSRGSPTGTPGYMSPEQAVGTEPMTPATDIFGLGATLYFLLVGQAPFKATSGLTELLKRVQRGEFPAPSVVRPTVPRALNAVCLKAMALRPAERYGSAAELKRDIERWLADEPVTAYRDPWTTRVRRWAKSHKTTVTASLVSTVLLLGAWGTWRWSEGQRVHRLSLTVQGALNDVESALPQRQFDVAKRNLDVAKGHLRTEPALSPLQREISAMEAQYESSVATDAEDQLRRADELRRESKFTEAGVLFARVRASLEGVEAFQTLRQRAVLGEEQSQAQEQADARWQQFRRLADKARFFGSNISSSSSNESASRALAAAEEAFQVYEIEDILRRKPEILATVERQEECRMLTFELLLIRAESQILANQEASKLTAKLDDSLELLARAEQLFAPQTSRLVWSQRMAYLQQLGRLADSEAAEKFAATAEPLSALEFYRAGEVARRVDRDFNKAERYYLEALSRSPHDYWVHFALSACQFERRVDDYGEDTGRDEKYLSSLIFAQSISHAFTPQSPWPLVLRGAAYASMHDFDHAEKDLADAEAIGENPRNFDFVLDPNRLRSAIRVNRAVLRIIQGGQAADEAVRDDYYERASAELQAALKNEDLIQARLNLSLVLSLLRRHAEAHDALTAALKHADAQEPGLRAQILQQRANVTLSRSPDNREFVLLAREDFREALRVLDQIPSGSANARVRGLRGKLREQLGSTYLWTQEWSLALAQFDAAARESDVSPNVHRLRGQSLMELNRPSDALDAYLSYDKWWHDPTKRWRGKPDVSALRTLAMLLLQLGRGHEALGPLTRSLEVAWDHKIATKRGWVLTVTDWQMLFKDFDQAIKQGGKDWEAYSGRGYARAKLGQHTAAIEDVEKAIRLGLQQIDAEPPPINPQQQKGILLFNSACTYAVAARQVRFVKPANAREGQSAPELTQRAVELLRQAQERLGPQALAAALTDDALDSIRETEEFRTFERQLSGAVGK
jgi:serine/threonine protein kinase